MRLCPRPLQCGPDPSPPIPAGPGSHRRVATGGKLMKELQESPAIVLDLGKATHMVRPEIADTIEVGPGLPGRPNSEMAPPVVALPSWFATASVNQRNPREDTMSCGPAVEVGRGKFVIAPFGLTRPSWPA